jgi:hypothetical protein
MHLQVGVSVEWSVLRICGDVGFGLIAMCFRVSIALAFLDGCLSQLQGQLESLLGFGAAVSHRTRTDVKFLTWVTLLPPRWNRIELCLTMRFV